MVISFCTEQTLLVPCRLFTSTVEQQWLEQLWNHKNIFETGVVRANEYFIIALDQ